MYLVTTICRRPSRTPETQPNGAVRRRLVEFLVFNSIYLKKSVSPDAEKVVRRRLVGFLLFISVYLKKSDPSSAENRVQRRLVEFLVFNSAFGRHRH